jgi:hypothetical protein
MPLHLDLGNEEAGTANPANQTNLVSRSDAFSNPIGILHHSPRLSRKAGLPWDMVHHGIQPQRGCAATTPISACATPLELRIRVDIPAVRLKPLGIGKRTV